MDLQYETETGFERSYFLKYDAIILNDKKEPLHGADPAARISFVNDGHYPHIHLVFFKSGTEYAEVATIDVVIRINWATSKKIALTEIESNESAKFAKFFESADETDTFYNLTFENTDFSTVCAENLFTETTAISLIPLRDYLQSGKPISIVIKGSEATEIDFNNFLVDYDQSKEPMTKWYGKHGDGQRQSRLTIQKGMFLGLSDRPDCSAISAVGSFLEPEEYLIAHLYGFLQEQELVDQYIQEYGTKDHVVRFITVPSCGPIPNEVKENGKEELIEATEGMKTEENQIEQPDRRYLVLIPMGTSEERFDLQAGDKINLVDPETEDLLTAMHGTVTEPIPGVPASMISAYVTRPWE